MISIGVLKTIGYCLTIGGVLLTISTMLGFARFDNIYTRIHISTINDMFAIPIAIIGVSFLFLSIGDKFNALKLCFAVILWYIIAPVSNYIVIKIAYFYNHEELMDTATE